jgi:cardiolipin synthase
MSFSMLGKLNRRNHRKVAVIDNRIAFVGGMNICESHSEVYSGIQAWRDTMLELEGPAILALLEAFESAWAAPIHEIFNIKIKKNFLQQKEDRRRREIAWLNWVRRNHSRRLRAHARHYLLRRFVMANRRIWITTPYFVPPPKMLHLLRKMAWSGVDVRLIVPKKSDIWFMTWVSRAFYFSMLRAGVRVFEYEPRVLHAKTMIVDDWFLVGSANFNHRSFLHDLEVEVRVAESSSRAVLVSQFEIDQAFSSEVLPTTWARRMFIPRIVGWFFTRFRYWF